MGCRQQGRKGQVLHIHQSFYAFLFNRDITENGGVFVTRTRVLVSQAPKGNLMKLGSLDSTKMNPAMNGGAVGGMVGSQMFRGPRDRLIGVSVSVKQGPYKAHFGTIKDVNGTVARVELQTGNKVITIDKSKLWRRKYVTYYQCVLKYLIFHQQGRHSGRTGGIPRSGGWWPRRWRWRVREPERLWTKQLQPRRSKPIQSVKQLQPKRRSNTAARKDACLQRSHTHAPT